MRLWGVVRGVISGLLSVALCGVARADFPSVNARAFQPPTDPEGSLFLEPTRTPGPGAFNTAAWLTYGFRPAVLRDANGDKLTNLVSHQLSADFLANLGIGQRFALGLDIPMVVYQQGPDNATTRAVAGGPPPAVALGDLALVGKANLLAPGALGGFGLATLLRFTAPTGNTRSYLGDGTPTGELRLLAEYRIIALALQATGGFRLRFEQTDVLSRTYNDAIPWGAAISVRPQAFGWDDQGRWTWVAEVHGTSFLPPGGSAADRGQSTPPSQVLAGASARFAPSDVSFLLGAEAGLTKGLGTPPFQVMASVQWAPRAHDIDHDLVPDAIDQCPELAEDRDGVEDADGCPDWDNDDDGVGDASDRCPGQKEDADGFQDDDGCPDPDNDHDGILDAQDACPDTPGEKSDDRKKNGCPDGDRDGVIDKKDKCPHEAEDRDGFQDADGCPDLDNDGDGVPDAEDSCPNVAGGPFGDPKHPGCPVADRDGDTFEDAEDKCPAEAEVWNGVEDADGCPDTRGKPLVSLDGKGTVTFVRAVRWKGGDSIEADSLPMIRALAAELLRDPPRRAMVSLVPAKAGASDREVAHARAMLIVTALRRYAHTTAAADLVEATPPGSPAGTGAPVGSGSPAGTGAPVGPGSPAGSGHGLKIVLVPRGDASPEKGP